MSSPKYKYLDHTADLKIRAWGESLEQAFSNSALAAFGFLTNISRVEKKLEKNIQLSASRKESLLYDFLEELLFLLDTEGIIFCEIRDMQIKKENNKFYLSCTALGDHYRNYEVKGNIKSVTYSEMQIIEKQDKTIIELVLDI